jgi:hypothetical protein
MAYPPKINLALDLLAKTGMGPETYAPVTYRLLWSLGVSIRPPHFQTFFANLLFMGGWFGATLTIVMWLISGQDRSIISIAIQGAIPALFFGLFMALWNWSRARTCKLPAWDEIDDVAHRFD